MMPATLRSTSIGPDGVLDLLDEVDDGLPVAHVAHAGVHLTPPSREPPGGGLEVVRSPGRDDDVVAPVEQLAGDEQTESARRSHDEGKTPGWSGGRLHVDLLDVGCGFLVSRPG